MKTRTETTFAPLEGPPNRVDQVVSLIRGQILSGELQAGESLPAEGRIAEQVGVSRTVVREAMHQLRSSGLVEVSHGRRPRVLAPTPTESIDSLAMWMRRSELGIHQLLEVRRPIECEIVKLACAAASPELIASLRDTIVDLRSASRIADRIAADNAFHRQLAEATGNPIYLLLLDALGGLLNEQRRLTLKADGARRAADDHAVILDSLLAQDSVAAEAAMRQHLFWPRT